MDQPSLPEHPRSQSAELLIPTVGIPMTPLSTPCTCNQEIVDDNDYSLQRQFTTEMRRLAQHKGHRSVAVLLISWDYGGLDTHDEVQRLHHVFKNTYHYRVREAWIKKQDATHKKPSLQMYRFIAQFLEDEDGSNSLLIIYYAGHGMQGNANNKEQIILHDGEYNRKGLTEIPWKNVEPFLRENTEADVLLIFDCCYAGLLLQDPRSSPSGTRLFEIITATAAPATAVGPGLYSFTSALIRALEEYSTREDGFTANQLVRKVRDDPYFKQTKQVPLDGERSLQPTSRRLTIRPLCNFSNPGRTLDFQLEKPKDEVVEYSLRMHFHWEQTPNEENMSALANTLWDLVEDKNLPIRNVVWGSLSKRVKFSDIAVNRLNTLRFFRRWRNYSISGRKRPTLETSNIQDINSYATLGTPAETAIESLSPTVISDIDNHSNQYTPNDQAVIHKRLTLDYRTNSFPTIPTSSTASLFISALTFVLGAGCTYIVLRKKCMK